MRRVSPLRVMGCPCLPFGSVQDARAYMEELLADGASHFSVAINAEKILKYREDGAFRAVVEDSRLTTPDGSGAVLALRWLHGASAVKLDLPRTALEVANERQLPVFVLGARPDVNEAACRTIAERYPRIRLVGRQDGYFTDEDQVIRTIAERAPRIVLLAMGSPKQENFAHRAAARTRGILFVGAGGALDILAGRISRAPAFMVENHLEWLYRLVKEPRRIRRQARLPGFFLSLLAEKMGWRSPP